MATEIVEEPTVKKKRVPVRGNPMKPDQITGYRELSSGPLPSPEESPPIDPKTREPAELQGDFLDILKDAEEG